MAVPQGSFEFSLGDVVAMVVAIISGGVAWGDNRAKQVAVERRIKALEDGSQAINGVTSEQITQLRVKMGQVETALSGVATNLGEVKALLFRDTPGHS